MLRSSAPELFGVYAANCATERNTWDLLSPQQQRGWAKVTEHIRALAAGFDEMNEHRQYSRHD
jgi:hypothetical protein